MMKTLALDFDGVLHSYTSGWSGPTRIPDPPVPGAMGFIVMAVKHFKVEIFSSRSGQPGGIDAMKHWLLLNLSENFGEEGERAFHKLFFPTTKPPAHLTIDDRAVCFTGEFPSMQEIRQFKPWNK